MKSFFKHMLIDALSFIIAFMVCTLFSLHEISIISWLLLAIRVVLVWLLVVISLNVVFFRNYTKELLNIVLQKVRRLK